MGWDVTLRCQDEIDSTKLFQQVELFPMGFQHPLYQEIAQHAGMRYFSMQSDETEPSWFVHCSVNPECRSIDCRPRLGDFNYMQCLLRMDIEDGKCRVMLRQQLVQVRISQGVADAPLFGDCNTLFGGGH